MDTKLEARGKPSTWLPRGGLVEHIFLKQRISERTYDETANEPNKNDQLIYLMNYRQTNKRTNEQTNQLTINPTDDQTNKLTNKGNET